MKELSFIAAFCTFWLITSSFNNCITTPQQPTTDAVSQTSAAVCIGVENGWAGPCLGSKLDSQNMFKLLKTQVDKVTLLIDKDVTLNNVKTALNEAVKSNLAIIYYSGHGGQDTKNIGDSSEEDGKDEYMCLYDKPLYDNDIWKILSTGKRVVLICDCCHSKTMYRTAVFSKQPMLLKAGKDSHQAQILCWSGCPDDTYSYGSATGGEFTNAILKYWTEGISYEELWNKLKSDTQLKKAEDIQQTIIGESFVDKPAFK